MSTKSQLPKSTATNAYDLLSEVRELILAEPKRFDQGTYIARLDGRGGAFGLQASRLPRCGTVGCVAGWVATLKYGDAFNYVETPVIAGQVLGLADGQRLELFGVPEEFASARPQSVKYAAVGAKHIRRFQKKYAAQLKAKRV